MSLSMRTMKTALAAFLAILVAQWLGLDYAVSAGIIAILSVLDTTKSSLLTAGRRVGSTLLALGVAVVLFYLFGFGTSVFALYLMIYVPLAYRFGVEAGIAPCSVLVTHLLVEQNISLPLLQNELLLMVIGAGIAILINVYHPSKNDRIVELRDEADQLMKDALLSLSLHLQNGIPSPPNVLEELNELLKEAEQLVFLESENRILTDWQYDLRYIEMRKDQAAILAYMQQNILKCTIPTEENKILAGLFYLTANQLHQNNTGEYILEDIRLLLQHFRQSDLPENRLEFENRAVLFQLLNDFTRFIQAKKDFFDEYGTAQLSNE
ncbi:aromatic acid exporter family protein [Jeotgalibaca caeni]|uniref:aromatic acid exporter family protein n=1 Tax=Jeotgalibaca caeni TaxID=3028623 RepID=UPI00237D7A20|nr:aromatic acid exporter family protein [Jeotgalibaca caeni]MDE1549636.1 aromatic acid exporter family protein [Jeotgalibaca caeni]